jgi:hypothetical protein
MVTLAELDKGSGDSAEVESFLLHDNNAKITEVKNMVLIDDERIISPLKNPFHA